MMNLQIRLMHYLLDGVHFNKYRIAEQLKVLVLLPFNLKSWMLNQTVKNKHFNALRMRSNNEKLYNATLRKD